MTDSSRPVDDRVRVLHVITRLIVGGAQECTIASTAGVDRARYACELWTGPQTGPEGSLFDEAKRRGVNVTVFPRLVREISPVKDLLVTFELARRMRRDRFDIVVTHSSKAGVVGRIAAWLAGVPHITHMLHGWGFNERMHPLVRGCYVGIERVLYWISEVLIPVSERTTRVGVEAGIGRPSKYRLIRSGIPLEVFRGDDVARLEARRALGVGPDEILIGSVGRLAPQKNPQDFIRVASAVLLRHEGVRFVYVGDGPMRDEIEEEIASAGIGDRLELLGLRDDVPNLLRAFDLFILTSLWEGLPRVVLQSLASGVPVVTYDIAGIEESVIEGRNGYLVSPGAVDDMVSRLDRLITDDSHRKTMSTAAAEEFDGSFSEREMIRSFERLFGELMAGAGEPACRSDRSGEPSGRGEDQARSRALRDSSTAR